jgi:hypothetical protein
MLVLSNELCTYTCQRAHDTASSNSAANTKSRYPYTSGLGHRDQYNQLYEFTAIISCIAFRHLRTGPDSPCSKYTLGHGQHLPFYGLCNSEQCSRCHKHTRMVKRKVIQELC